ncbi:ester hydrolase C11orf54 homolog [Branchiostoma floridae x Branchiostoma japonicum]
MAEREMAVDRKEAFVPPLDELAAVLQAGLSSNYLDAKVKVVDCPDLTQPPFTLAAPGLCGSPRVADVGGVPYLIPSPQLDKKFNLEQVAGQVDLPGAFVLGAGAGAAHVVGVNCEMMPNIRTTGGAHSRNNQTRVSRVNTEDGTCILEHYEDTYQCRDFCLLANLFFCEGKPGKVLEVKAKVRTGQENFVSCMRKTLEQQYGDRPVALGGTFLLEKGQAKIHIMPGFSKTPLQSEEDVNNWLNFFEMSGPLINLSVFVSRDPGLDLRVEHTHCFSHHGEGGHYHYDTTPEEVEYRGYFLPAEYIYRVDRPKVSHMIGRD